MTSPTPTPKKRAKRSSTWVVVSPSAFPIGFHLAMKQAARVGSIPFTTGNQPDDLASQRNAQARFRYFRFCIRHAQAEYPELYKIETENLIRLKIVPIVWNRGEEDERTGTTLRLFVKPDPARALEAALIGGGLIDAPRRGGRSTPL